MFRLNGSLPKVGIRPIIDGRRRGIRESLEGNTMGLAKLVAEFIENNLRHPSGEKVECVIADTTIGGVAEAARCEEKFERENVGVSLSVTQSWCYGTETVDMNPSRPKAIWGFNATERPGAVYLAAALAGQGQFGLPTFAIYGHDVYDANDLQIPADVEEKIVRFIKAGLAVATMKNKSYLAIGSVSMGIAGSIVKPELFQEYLGMRNEFVDMSEVKRRLELNIFDPEEYQVALKWVKEHCQLGEDINVPELKFSEEKIKEDWETVVKMTLICRDLMIGNPKLKEMGFDEEAEGHNAIAAGFQGQRAWTDFMPTGDFLETILNTSFDWNGIREAFVVATENDTLNAIPMLFGHLLTGRAQQFSDIRTYWSPKAVKRVTGYELTGLAKNGFIHLLNSGSTTLDSTGEMVDTNGTPMMKQYWDITEEDVNKSLKATKFCPANRQYMRGGGFSSDFLTRGNLPVTMSRINYIKGLGPVLQIAEGYTLSIPEDVHNSLDRRTDPTWPTTWFVPNLTGKDSFKTVYDVMNDWGSNHGAISYGHIGADIITLASMLRIPVAMHNVPEEKIFRPKVWGSFGTKDLEGADFRACQALGPMYK
ncbi:MAG: L-fucose isomerase [Haloplasmataceae bacterium]|jgi:L-fucose isomerase|nr:L-fucose isomerase [Haloplasmataceae bacterium]